MELQNIVKKCDRSDALEMFVHETARSYLQGLSLIDAVGTRAFTKRSIEIYGHPRDLIAGQQKSVLDTAESLLAGTEAASTHTQHTAADFCVLPQSVANEIRAATQRVFGDHPVDVVVDEGLASKAAAGARRIRIRGATCFSKEDTRQLIEHEVLVHTLTAINGRSQSRLQALGLGAPRTTTTQEGLAVFAEFITNAMDLQRLRRLCARVKAIDLALNGADFIDVFEFLLATGQTDSEAAQSAMRVFRGGDPKGGGVFTKDTVYLRGFIEVHLFLKAAILRGDYDLPHFLMAGRMALSDLEPLSESFENGVLALPAYEPEWLSRRSNLLCFLMYSAVIQNLRLESSE